jgi:uncharacterized protein YoxC
MTNEEMEHGIQFLLGSQAKLSADIDRLTEDIKELREAQRQTDMHVREMAANVSHLTEGMSTMREEMSTTREEMRDAINNLIIANEVTRNLAEQAARLAIATSQRVTNLESKLT